MTADLRQFAKQIPGLRPLVLQLRELRRTLIPRSWVFTGIYERNEWGDPDSVSGEGSNLEQTQFIREQLPGLWQRHGVRRVVDAPCGDFHWMRELAGGLESYTGVDIVAALVERNNRMHGSDRVRFQRADIVRDKLPAADLIFCRDCLVHLSVRDIWSAIENMRSSGAQYLLTTTFTDRDSNPDIETGQWRPLNLEAAPFHFPKPIELLNEHCTQRGNEFADKSLGLWRLSDLP